MASVWIEGEDRLFANMNRLIDDVGREAHEGLKRAGMNIIADAQQNMRTAGHMNGTLVTTGQLRASGRVQEIGNGDLDVGFFSKNGSRGYAAAVEYGSRPHWAPIAPLKAWARKKLREPERSVNSAAYAVQWSIHRKGTQKHPFFNPAIRKNKRKIENVIRDAINAVITKNSANDI